MIKTLGTLDYNRELIELLLLDKIGAIALYLAMPVAYFILFRDIVPLEILFVWLFMQVLMYIIRTNITQDFLAVLFTEEDARIKQLLKFQLTTVFMNALLWGVAASLTVVFAEENLVLMMIAALFLMFTFSIATLTPIFHAIFIFIVTIIFTFATSLIFLTDSYIYNLSTIFLLAYLVLFIPVTFKVYKVMLTSIKQKEEILFFNYNLEKKISDATNELEEKNIKLTNSVENFQTLLDATMEMIIIIDINKIIIDVNRAGVEMLGANSKENLIGRRLPDFVQEKDRHKLTNILKANETERVEFSMRKIGGEDLPTLANSRDVIQKGKTLRILTIQDLTQVQQRERQLLQQSRMAQMGEMLSMIAHQWRQPLGAISSAIFGIQTKLATGKYDGQESNEELYKYLDTKHVRINEYVQFLSTTIDDFRNFFKPDKKKELVLFESPIKRALQIVESSLVSKKIEVISTFNVNEKVEIFQNEIMQVILNIIKNAEDNFLERGTEEPKINIETQLKPVHYEIVISDNGGGISEHIIANVFDPYFSTKDEKNGSGLGLYMSKMMIEEHSGGLLQVENTQEGAAFKILLPNLNSKLSNF
ncbi:MAG: PAS domain-containing sensor histidine kinase [Campylobacterota bacterium]|nr:PAS domain-containing sensor histidine kinase [Campylobacterota bacterium]